jgi:hypothetical protein
VKKRALQAYPSRDRFFTRTRRLKGPPTLRASVGTQTSLTWPQS